MVYANLPLNSSSKCNMLSHMSVLWSKFVFDSHCFPEMFFFFFSFSRILKLSIKMIFFFPKKIPFRKKEVEENKGKQPVTVTHYVPYKL